jgi:hypothetical protein
MQSTQEFYSLVPDYLKTRKFSPTHVKALESFAAGTPLKDIAQQVKTSPSSLYRVIRLFRNWAIAASMVTDY